MAIYRHVQVAFWKDVKVSEEMTPEDKLFYLYLLTNPNTTQIGIYAISKKQMAFDLGYSIETIQNLLDRFEKYHRLIRYNLETREVVILNWGKYNFNRAGKPVEDCVRKELQGVKDKSLIQLVLHNIKNERIQKLFLPFINKRNTAEKMMVKTTDIEIVNEHVHEQITQRCKSKCELQNDSVCKESYDTSTSRLTIRGQKEKEKQKQKVKDKDQPNGRSNVYPKEFEEFWSLYPRKVGKKRSFGLWKRRVKQETTADEVLLAAKHYAVYCQEKGLELEYIKHPSTFLSNKLDYEDWVIPPVKQQKKSSEPKSDLDIRMEQDMVFFNQLFEAQESVAI